MADPIIFYALDKEWELEEINPGVRKTFSAWCAARARQELFETKDELSGDAYTDSLSCLNRDIAAGEYRWGSPLGKNVVGQGVRRMLQSGDGQAKLLALLLRKRHPDVTLETAGLLMEENPEMVGECMRLAVNGPNSPAAESPPTTGNGGSDSPKQEMKTPA